MYTDLIIMYTIQLCAIFCGINVAITRHGRNNFCIVVFFCIAYGGGFLDCISEMGSFP